MWHGGAGAGENLARARLGEGEVTLVEHLVVQRLFLRCKLLQTKTTRRGGGGGMSAGRGGKATDECTAGRCGEGHGVQA